MKHLGKILLIVLMLALFYLSTVRLVALGAAADSFLGRFPFWAACALFVGLYVAANFIVVDIKDPLKLAAALLFGAWGSSLLIYLAEIINALLFFNLARRLGQDFTRKVLHDKPGAFYDRLSSLNLGWVFLLRALPLVPYRVQDIVFGLSRLKLRHYMMAVVFASLPRILFIQLPLAAVRSFSPQGFNAYWLNNPPALVYSAGYVVFSCVAAALLSRKLKKNPGDYGKMKPL